jgi:hypothetical protein
MNLLASLDRFVHAARLDVLTPYRRPRPRSLRWLPLLVLLALAAGYAMLAASIEGHGRSLWTGVGGASLFFTAYLGASLIRFFGPRLAPEQGPLDERELMLKARAGRISGIAISCFAVLACFYAGLAVGLGLWMPRVPLEYFYLGLGIQAAALALPVLAASWLQPPPADED